MTPQFSIYNTDRSAFPVLPDKMQRDAFLRLVAQVGRKMFGLTDEVIATFRAFAERTTPGSFVSSDSEPVCYQQQVELAYERDLSADTIRRHEKILERVGLIEIRTKANGARSGFSGCGIYFSAAIALVPQMQAFRDHLEHQRKEAARLRGRISTHKRFMKGFIEQLEGNVNTASLQSTLIEQLSSWPEARQLRRMELKQLSQVEFECDQQCVDAQDLIKKTSKMHGQAGTNAVPYIQDTTEDSHVICNQGERTRASADAEDSSLTNDAPNGTSNCLEDKSKDEIEARNTKFADWFSVSKLYRICGEEMRFTLDGRTLETNRSLTEHDFVIAAWDRAAQLGISQHAMAQARDALGEYGLALCVIMTDAAASREINPVRSPGGYMRALIKAHRNGTLNIVGSLIGISERAKSDAEDL